MATDNASDMLSNHTAQLFGNVPDNWIALFNQCQIDAVLRQIPAKNCAPNIGDIFNFARYTALDNIRVVIVGQDPYPTPGDADGLAFSTAAKKCPASLKNIFTAMIKTGVLREYPTQWSLKHWAEQGVLLINSALTTEIGQRNAHQKIWHPFTAAMLHDISLLVNRYDKLPIFVLWGNDAKKHCAQISDQVTVLSGIHPSPMNGVKFHTCDHFKRLDELLRPKINWSAQQPATQQPATQQPATQQPATQQPATQQPTHVEEYFCMTPEKAVVFTDGSCYPNKLCKEARGGYAAFWAAGVKQGYRIYGSLAVEKHFASNQRAEGVAILMVIKRAMMDNIREIEIVSDSEFWINMFTIYMPAWTRDNVDFRSKKNSDLTTALWKAYNEYIGVGRICRFRHMRSHDALGWSTYAKNTWQFFCYSMNDYVDQLASYARQNMQCGTHSEGFIPKKASA